MMRYMAGSVRSGGLDFHTFCVTRLFFFFHKLWFGWGEPCALQLIRMHIAYRKDGIRDCARSRYCGLVGVDWWMEEDEGGWMDAVRSKVLSFALAPVKRRMTHRERKKNVGNVSG